MYSTVLFALFACASAAPSYHHHRHHGFGAPPPFPRDDYDNYGLGNLFLHDNIFDTRRFWMELSREMAMFDQIMTDFAQRFPSTVSSEGIDTKTNEYKVTIPLAGFEIADINVKARKGILMVQAIHNKEGSAQRNYLDMRTLPDFVNINGSWTFQEGVLKIVFPILPRTGEGETTTQINTELPELFKPESREEVDKQNNDNQDADVGVKRGDVEKELQLNTNEISERELVEATTYAVDLKNEIEFVPVSY